MFLGVESYPRGPSWNWEPLPAQRSRKERKWLGLGGAGRGTELLSLLMMPLDSDSCSLILALGPSPTSWGSSSFFWRFWEGSGILKCMGDHGKKTGPAPGRLLGRGGWHLQGAYSTPRLPAWGVHAVAWKPTNPSSYQPSVQGWVGFVDPEPPCRVLLMWAEEARAPPFQIFNISKGVGDM